MKIIAQSKGKRQKKVKVEMTGKGLTIFAGLLPILNFMTNLGFRERMIEGLSMKRAPNARYQLVDAIQMVVAGLIAGGTAMDHVASIWRDKVLQMISGCGDVPVATTLGRIFKTVTNSNVEELKGLVHHYRGRVWKGAIRAGKRLKSPLSVMWLDADSTVESVDGNQEGAEKGYNPKRRGKKSYHPLLAFVSETNEILHSRFRCGSAYSSNGIVSFMKECMAHIRGSVKVILRGDSAFFIGELFDYLDSIGGGYLVKVKLKGLQGLLEGQVWRSVTGRPDWEQVEFSHKCRNWSKSRRFVAVRELKEVKKGLFDLYEYNYFCYVTTESLTPVEAHRKYGKRATCETWIEEFKGQVKGLSIRTSDFLANAALFQCGVLAYNILRWMALLTGGIVRHWEVKTIRLWLVRVAGKLVVSGRRLILKLPETFLHQKEWIKWERMSLTVTL